MAKDDELANAITEAEAKAPEELTDRDKMALMGRPKIGDITRAQLRIKESKEFKVIYFVFHFVCFADSHEQLITNNNYYFKFGKCRTPLTN